MDPDETYAQMRAALMMMSEAMNEVEYSSAASDLWSAVVNLDGWICQGGFLPAAWREPTRLTTL